MKASPILITLLCVLPCALLGGCGVAPETLMVTPVLYDAKGIDPFSHLDASHRTTVVPILYATNRARDNDGADPARYGNTPTSSLQLGTADVRFGENVTWENLHQASRVDPRDRPIVLELGDVREVASIESGAAMSAGASTGEDAFFATVNERLSRAKDPEILIYVHGAKVDFYNACVFGAEIDHFTGRDLVTIAFAWPTHQNIFAYLAGEDVQRARQSAPQLASFLRQLAARTTARRINIVCWSAGGRVVARALDALGRPDRDDPADPRTVRIGAVVFAAPDVPVHLFVQELPNIHRVAERIVVTASDDDIALQKASDFMGEGQRAGSIGEQVDGEERDVLERLDRIELVDVSYGQDQRGFDIGGHRYWFRHAWVASDVILVARTRLPAGRRGLQASPIERVWFLPIDYPDRVREAAREALGSTW